MIVSVCASYIKPNHLPVKYFQIIKNYQGFKIIKMSVKYELVTVLPKVTK